MNVKDSHEVYMCGIGGEYLLDFNITGQNASAVLKLLHNCLLISLTYQLEKATISEMYLFTVSWMYRMQAGGIFIAGCDRAALIPHLHRYQYNFHSFICQQTSLCCLNHPSQLQLHIFNYQSKDWHLHSLWSSCLQRRNYWDNQLLHHH